MKPVIIFDYGHGCNCPGKCSPDGSFYEWQSNRLIGRLAAQMLRVMGYTVVEVWSGDHEPLSNPLKTCSTTQLRNALNWRAREVNRLCKVYSGMRCILVSWHSNAAASDGQWHDARGFCVMVGTKASQASKRIARLIYNEAARRGLQGNRCVPAEKYWVQPLAMCNNTNCPAVLIEAMFYDNRQDLALLKSESGQQDIASAVVEGLTKYLSSI